MSEENHYDDDDLEEIESLDELTELLGQGNPGSNSARRRIEELKEELLLRKLLDNDYPEMF